MSDLLPESYGQGFEAPNTSEVTGGEEIQSTTNEETTETQSNRNPAWESALAAIPPEFHSHLESHFSEWDKGVQKRFEKVQQDFSPLKAYKEFADLNVPTTDIQEALKFYQAVNTQPKAVYDYLQKQYNYQNENSQGQREEQVEDYDLSEEVDLSKNPQFKAMAEKAEAAEKFMQQVQQKERQDAANKAVDAEANKVKEAYPHLDIADVATFALGNAKQNNVMPDLMAAAEYLSKLVTPQTRASDTAPPIVSGGNRGIPQPPAKHPGDMTSDERSAYIAARMAALNAG